MSGRYRSKRDEGKSLGKLRGQGREVVNGEMKTREEQPIRKQQVGHVQSEGGKGTQEVGCSETGEGVSEGEEYITSLE